MKKLISSLLCLLLMGCETWPQIPEKGAAYRTADETYIVENTSMDEFYYEMTHDPNLKSGRYKEGGTLTWENQ